MNQCRGQECSTNSGKATVPSKLLGPKTFKIFHPEKRPEISSSQVQMAINMGKNMSRCDNICCLL